MNRHRYEEDVLAWTEEQAALLRAGEMAALDRDNIAEEIASLGINLKRELRNRLALLIQHLLTYEFQAEFRSSSWKSTIARHRSELEWLLEDSPSLRRHVETTLPKSYAKGRRAVLQETGLFRLPDECPYRAEQILDPDWLPE